MKEAYNPVSGIVYSGTNQATLGTGKWATFLQWKSLSRNIIQGQKGTRIIKFLENTVRKDNGKVEEKVGFRYYVVFEEGQTVEAK